MDEEDAKTVEALKKALAELAGLDPAEAPEKAEELAAELARLLTEPD